MHPAVDAIIPVYAEPSENLSRTVEGLLNQEPCPDRILAVDDASPDPVTLQERIAPRVELLRLEENGGAAAARNSAAALSSADYLLFVNCDVVLLDNWLRSGLSFMESHPAGAVVGGAIIPQVGSHLLRRWRMRFLENPEQRTAEERKVTWVTGHATLVRRAMFEEVGGFDARYGQSGEDSELCTRFRASGYEVHHVPELVAESYEIPSIDLFARKSLRNSGWDLRKTCYPGSAAIGVRPIQLLPASASVIRALANHSSRNLYKRRFSFLPIDAAVAARSLVLVWSTCLRRLQEPPG
jgi:cellulose synthase/poly-beta-1,6-N-acetylglucosamine synthase-like glycosyltransferase